MLRYYKDTLICYFRLDHFIFLLIVHFFFIIPPFFGESPAVAVDEKPQHLSFQELPRLSEHFDGKKVEIRGFVYRSGQGDFLISPTPNLKSCCIGSAHQTEKQIFLTGDFSTPTPRGAITLQGVLHLTTDLDHSGTVNKRYQLSDWSVAEESRITLPYLTVIISLAALLIFWLASKKSPLSKLLSHKTTNF